MPAPSRWRRQMCKWAKWNGRIRGMKMPSSIIPMPIAHATSRSPSCQRQRCRNRQPSGDRERATYVFDKGYYHFEWWKKINESGAFFVTRTKVNTSFRKPPSAAMCANASVTASGSSTTQRSRSPARATLGCRSRCDEFASSATRVQPSLSSPMISSGRRS